MQIEIVESVHRVFEVELHWDELYKTDPYATIYLSHRFISSIAARAPGKFRILMAWSDDNRCIGIFPLLLKTRWSKTARRLYNELDMLGHVFDSDYTGILCDPACETIVCEAFAREISRMPCGRVILSFFSGPASRLERFSSAFDPAVFEKKHTERKINAGKTNNLVCPYIDLPGDFSEYLQSLSANSRQKLRRLLRQLENDSDLQVTRSRPETYKQDATILSELWFLQYAEQKGQKRATRLAEQFREVAMIGLAHGMVYLAILWRAGRPVAAQANYVDPVKKQALFHVGGRDESVRDLAIGLMLQAHCIRWSIAQGLKRYDFTLGDEPYKYSFGAVDRKIASVEICTRTGANLTDRLDEASRDDVAVHIRRYAARGRSDDARIAARQALAVWPELAAAVHVETLIAKAEQN